MPQASINVPGVAWCGRGPSNSVGLTDDRRLFGIGTQQRQAIDISIDQFKRPLRPPARPAMTMMPRQPMPARSHHG